MRLPDDDADDITVHRLLSIHTSGVRGEPRAVLAIQASGGVMLHVILHLDDMAALGRRLTADAQLMGATPDLGGGKTPS